ncbi:MAG TPA: AEC family transporter [Anaerolineales bacterium]|nr:AEC family transporter [Anaerolineales bacterium]
MPDSNLPLLLSILANQIAPILLTAGAGFAVGRRFNIDIRAVSRLSFYIFSPCLVFVSLYETKLEAGDFGRMALFTISVILGLGFAAFAFGKLIGLNRHALAGLIVVNMFGNGGNYGLPLNLFAFGEAALAHAVVYYVTSTMLVYSLGIVVASSGRASLRESIVGVFQAPVVYGVIVAVALRLTGLELPLMIFRAVKLLSGAALPVMLIVLGLQLAEVKRPPDLRIVTVASIFQLISGPALGLLAAAIIGLTGPARQAAVLEAAMPTAVITTILAVEYDIDPIFVTGIVLVTTLLSPLTITPLIALLQS